MISKFVPLFLFCLFVLVNSCASLSSQKKMKHRANPSTTEVKAHNNLGEGKKNLKEYIWVSENKGRNMEVHFICDDNNQMDISIKDPAQTDFVKGHPAYIEMAVEYSPILGFENDIRLTHRGGVFLKTVKILKIKRENIQKFLENLHILHLQDIKNKKKIREEYNRAVNRCESFKEERQGACYKTLTTGPYMISNQPSITLNIISNVIPPKNARPIRFLAGFDSEQLFQNLKKLSCYKVINE